MYFIWIFQKETATVFIHSIKLVVLYLRWKLFTARYDLNL